MIKKNKTKKIIIPILIIIFIIGGYLAYSNIINKGSGGLTLSGLYDSDGKLISTGIKQAMIGDVEGVKYITLKVKAENLDTIPLDFSITSSSPAIFTTSLNNPQVKTTEAGNIIEWESGLIDVEPFVNTTTNFKVTILAQASARTPVEKSFILPITIKPDPDALFDIIVEDEISDSTTNTTEEVNNDPGVTGEDGTQSTSDFSTNAEGGFNSYKSGTWVKVDTDDDGIVEQYDYSSVTITSSCPGTKLTITPEGFNVNYRKGSSGVSVYICGTSNEHKTYR